MLQARRIVLVGRLPDFMARDLTRERSAEVVQLGLERTNGNYRLLVQLLQHAGGGLQAVSQLPAQARLPLAVPEFPRSASSRCRALRTRLRRRRQLEPIRDRLSGHGVYLESEIASGVRRRRTDGEPAEGFRFPAIPWFRVERARASAHHVGVLERRRSRPMRILFEHPLGLPPVEGGNAIDLLRSREPELEPRSIVPQIDAEIRNSHEWLWAVTICPSSAANS